jgi:hypothetical protein
VALYLAAANRRNKTEGRRAPATASRRSCSRRNRACRGASGWRRRSGPQERIFPPPPCGCDQP